MPLDTTFAGLSARGEGLFIGGTRGALWITDFPGNRVDRITTNGVKTLVVSGIGSPGRIIKGPDANIWVLGASETINKVTPNGLVTTYTNPNNSYLWQGMCVTDNNIWITGETGGPSNEISLFRVTPAGSITQETQYSGYSELQGDLVVGNDGNLWTCVISGSGGSFSLYALGFNTSGVKVKSVFVAGGNRNGGFGFRSANGNIYGISATGNASSFEIFSVDTVASSLSAGWSLGIGNWGPFCLGIDNNIWIFGGTGNALTAYSQTGSLITNIPLGAVGSSAICLGEDKNFWMPLYTTNSVLKISTTSLLAGYSISPTGQLTDICVGP